MSTNGHDETATPPPVSRIVLTFPGGEGTSGATIALEHVDPGQVYGAAYFLDLLAHELRAATEAQRLAAMPQGVPPDVQRVVADILAGKGH